MGIYIHIPFCAKKCKYCDFVSFDDLNDLVKDYCNALIKEIDNIVDELKENAELDDIKIDTIYIGGGTPSIIPETEIEKILNRIKSEFNIIQNVEITIEVNPGTASKEKLERYYNIGINRLSIGLQSTNNSLLKMLGRVHNYKQFEEVFDISRKIGFNNINVDLMIGLPNQKLEDVEESVLNIMGKNPEHISVYSLIVEENTQMYDMVYKGELILPDEELERKMYWKVKELLEQNGYYQYEISNFSKKGYESKHNVNCWNQCEYIGFGVSAHSYIEKNRTSNIENIKTYINNCLNGDYMQNVILHEHQSSSDMMKEYMLLGLRKIEGVNIQKFKEKFIKNPIYLFKDELNRLYNMELIEIEDNFIKLTNKGIDLANIVWEEFV